MLVNLSNHPTDSWQEEQKQKAIELYAEIVDIPFPEVDPFGDEQYIQELADEYLVKVLEKLPVDSDHNAVHIMGESSFCFALINRLKKRNVRCIASTTARDVFQESNEMIIKYFKFIRFREYV